MLLSVNLLQSNNITPTSNLHALFPWIQGLFGDWDILVITEITLETKKR